MLRERRNALLVAAIVLMGHGYFFHYYEKIINPNETSRLYLTMAIVDEGTLSINGPMDRHGVTWDRSEYRGRFYCDKAPGLSVLAVPFYAIARGVAKLLGTDVSLTTAHLVVRWGTILLPTALFCALLYLWLGTLLPSVGLRALLVLLYAMATPARIYGGLFFGHQTSAVLSAAGILLLFRYGGAPGWRAMTWMIAAGLFLGASFATEYPTFISVVIAGGLSLFAARPFWRVPFFGLAIAIPVGLTLLYNMSVFGNPFSPGYAHLASGFAEVHAKGLFGVTTPSAEAFWGAFFSPTRGLFFLSPWLLAALPGCYLLIRERATRAIALVSFATLLGYAYFISSFSYWVGGDSAGPRHIVPLVPLLVIPVAAALHRVSKGAWEATRLLSSATFAYSIALVNFVSMTFSYFSPAYLNPYRDMTLEFWKEGLFPHNMGSVVGLSGYYAAFPYLCGLAALVLFACVAWPRSGERGLPRRLLSAAYPLGTAVLALVAVLSLRPEGRTPWAAHEVHRYMIDFTPSNAHYQSFSRATREALVLRGNHAVLVRNPEEAVRLYREAARLP